MPIIRATVTIPMDSGVAEDAVTNTFHFNVTDAVAGSADIEAKLEEFYGVNTTTGDSIFGSIMSGNVDNLNVVLRTYNLSDPEPRVPVLTSTLSGLPGPPASALPPELAICLSYRAAYTSGTPNARRRGRIFIGPLNDSVNGAGIAGDVVVFSARDTIAAAADRLATASDAVSDWVVRSDVGNTTATVIAGWVDDAFDVQRRRGIRATARSSWSV